MKRRNLVVSLTVTVLIALIALAATLAAGWSPKLGLDLAGGSEVVYKPAHTISSGQMNTTIGIIRNRVDAAGVSGATVDSQGGNVVVQLPGIKNPGAVIKLIGETAQLQFRPVLCLAGPSPSGKATATPGLPASCSSTQYSLLAPNLTVTPDSTSAAGYTTNLGQIPADPILTKAPTTSPDWNDTHPNAAVLVPIVGGGGDRYLLGPTALSGTAVAPGSAQAVFSTPSWVVDVSLTSAGSPKWDALAQRYFHQLIGIDLDGQVQSAPLTQPTNSAFQSFGGKVQISGNFTQTSAQNLAVVLNYGSLPVRLIQIDKEQVSPTLGKSSLKAGLAAGAGGLALVLLYMIFYYRALGVVVVSGLLVTAAILWAIVSGLGRTGLNLTLDLAGVTGLIVSVGITVDSYIVYFERLKDEARAGRSVRTSVDKSFRGAFRTVLAADIVSLAAAVVLYLLSVGTVKGFAFFLGLSTLLDVFTTFFFTRPLVILLGRSRTVTDARIIGIARGLAVDSGVGA
ncbi:MAG: protein translocase subunit SecD [Acidimicrobiales bacterium]